MQPGCHRAQQTAAIAASSVYFGVNGTEMARDEKEHGHEKP